MTMVGRFNNKVKDSLLASVSFEMSLYFLPYSTYYKVTKATQLFTDHTCEPVKVLIVCRHSCTLY